MLNGAHSHYVPTLCTANTTIQLLSRAECFKIVILIVISLSTWLPTGILSSISRMTEMRNIKAYYFGRKI